MILDKVLILKGLAGVTTLGGAVTVGVVGKELGWWGNNKLTPEEIKKALGLPADDNNCVLPTNDNETKTCSNINTEKLKNINFEGKGSGESSITGSGTVTLTITKTNDTTTFPQGYKFSFNPTEEVTISSSPTLKIAKNSNTEFKIKGTSASNLTLEKAWTAKSLGEKIGLTCSENNGNKECSLPSSKKINLFISASDKTEEATIKEECKDKKITYQEDQEGHNQGFKFTVTEEITLNSTESVEKKIEKDNVSYEIKQDSDGKWYLTKYTATN